MNAYTAVKDDEMVVLNYDPEARQISIEDGDVISISDAKLLFDRALVADCNPAMTTLCLNHYDTDAVQELNADKDGYRPAEAVPTSLRREDARLNDIIEAATDILAEQGTHHYNLFIDKHEFDRVFQALDEIRNNMNDERDGLNDHAAPG